MLAHSGVATSSAEMADCEVPRCHEVGKLKFLSRDSPVVRWGVAPSPPSTPSLTQAVWLKPDAACMRAQTSPVNAHCWTQVFDLSSESAAASHGSSGFIMN